MNPELCIKQIEIGPMENFSYLIGDRKTHEAFIVDPAWDAGSIINVAKKENFQIVGTLLTHTHFDHINALSDLAKETNNVAYIHTKEAGSVKEMGINVRKTEDRDKIMLGGIEINVIHTPGHTPGSQCFLVEGNLFSGDTLFINACGRCDLQGSDPKDMYQSLKRLSALPDETVVYPGHNYADEPTSTIGKEKKFNPYFQPAQLESFLKFRMGE
jgi:glyoxylase-like metal-dependent hydrolase (beta-lactamase superfamily II)